MIYDQVKPGTIAYNTLISEFERNVKIFNLLSESKDSVIQKMGKQNVIFMKKAIHEMQCIVLKQDCKCDNSIVSKRIEKNMEKPTNKN